MKKVFVGMFAFFSFVIADEIHWSYEGENGPDRWADLSPDFYWCKLKNQSPVNISNLSTIEAVNPKIKTIYGNVNEAQIVNNGHTVQINVNNNNYGVEFNGKFYKLIQFHFHSPSEHTINNKQFPMELHLVHKSKEDELLVIGVMIKNGKSNKILNSIFKHAPEEEHKKEELKENININLLLPKNKDYYLYSGSLTTPPCTEGVTWVVLKTPIMASIEDIEKFKRIMKHPNNRPVQPLNSRFIIK